jgi:hypothetical protein
VTSSITSIAAGKATLSLTAGAAAAAGSFPVTITGSANGITHSQTAQLNISPVSSTSSQQWEYQVITANSEKDVVDQANNLGAQEWELVSVEKVAGTTNAWRAFFKRVKRNF